MEQTFGGRMLILIHIYIQLDFRSCIPIGTFCADLNHILHYPQTILTG